MEKLHLEIVKPCTQLVPTASSVKIGQWDFFANFFKESHRYKC